MNESDKNQMLLLILLCIDIIKCSIVVLHVKLLRPLPLQPLQPNVSFIYGNL